MRTTRQNQEDEAPPVILRGVTDFTTEDQVLYFVVGEVVNNSGGSLDFVQVLGSFYDAEGELVDTFGSFALLEIVKAGETAPFELMTDIEPSAPIHRYELAVEHRSTDDEPLQVQILSHQASTLPTGAYEIRGEVQNPYDHALEFVEVVATCYGAHGDVLCVGSASVSEITLNPGQVSPFELSIDHRPSDEVVHCKLQTQASKGLHIPGTELIDSAGGFLDRVVTRFLKRRR